tara:strand:- start:3182 stop:3841 length:660 start_codon:yes stop_codon:yes gene_type:complete
MGWGGSVSAMIQSLKNNKELLGSKREYHRTKVKVLQSAEKLKIKYKEATPLELKLVREKVKKQRLINKLKTIIVILALSPLIFIVGRSCWNVIKEEIPKSEDQILMDFYSEIKKGDFYLKKNQYDKAKTFYWNADHIKRNTEAINIREAFIEVSFCFHNNENCFYAKKLLKNLKYKNNSKVKKLNSLLTKAYSINNNGDTIIKRREYKNDSIFDEFFGR